VILPGGSSFDFPQDERVAGIKSIVVMYYVEETERVRSKRDGR
jgi:hypothetical protein